MLCNRQYSGSEVLGFQPVAGDEVPRTHMTGEDLPLVLQEVNHRIRNLLPMIEMVLGQTQSTTIEEYRAKVTAQISGLSDFYKVTCRLDAGKIGIAELLEQTMRPYCAAGGRIIACGPDIDLDPRLALSLHLVIHELATNAKKYGALSSARGAVKVDWEIWQAGGPARKLAIVWSENGGPEVKHPQCRGFGSRLITRALSRYGDVRLDFRPMGVACYMLIDPDREMGAWR